MKGKTEFLYDSKYDILTLKVKNVDYDKSLELQEFIVDFNKDGFISGVRLFNASKILSKLTQKRIKPKNNTVI